MTAPISIVTGFLGSGKTTLLRHLLEQGIAGQRIALIVNEIGEVGFDGQVVAGLNVAQMIELTSGCICCSIGTDFLLAVEEILTLAAPDLIIVETTGLAEPSGLIRQARAGDLPLDAIVTLVDVANIAQQLEQSPVAAWQLRAADFLVLNKCDLVSAAELAQVHALLQEHNGRATRCETSHGRIDPRLLFAGPALPRPAEADPPPHDHLHTEQIGTLLWQTDAPLERTRIEAVMRELPPQIYRAKGYVHCTDAPWPALVNVVSGRVDYETTRFKQAPAYLNQLVFIGSAIGELQPALFARLAACVDTAERAADWQARRA
ncbi:MAG: CobW family GTP-binding protein [Chloroflexaceae bacterium]